jgi:hypothetical protein
MLQLLTGACFFQVLISLQGLVLVSKPYFNEAGYEKQMGTIEGEKNSLVYNESSYLLVCKSMQYLIKRPPKVSCLSCLYHISYLPSIRKAPLVCHVNWCQSGLMGVCSCHFRLVVVLCKELFIPQSNTLLFLPFH